MARSALTFAVLATLVAAPLTGLALQRPDTATATATEVTAREATVRVSPALPASPAEQRADALGVERRLAQLRFDVGTVDGVLDDDTKHAVTALQKLSGLPRTGALDPATRQALAGPVAVELKHPTAVRSFEVDLTNQVMLMSKGGRLERIIDVSTGSNQMILVSGKPEKAITPLGTFAVTRKINGMRIAPLGELYRPAYFVEGWAVHGSPEVSPTPVSHGCVRVTNTAMDRLYDLFTIGTPITLYGKGGTRLT